MQTHSSTPLSYFFTNVKNAIAICMSAREEKVKLNCKKMSTQSQTKMLHTNAVFQFGFYIAAERCAPYKYYVLDALRILM